ncbi:histidine phosphatase family protein [Flavobacteriales bacterium 34_180_T64]|nr:histidine phosphatase family protein [Flavobacteriales bacterium 34_180_T64]
MKTLVFIRHGKSSWEYDVSDKDRPLKSRGIRDANMVSKQFETTLFTADCVISSPANRAISTCNIFAKNLRISPDLIQIHEEIYDFGGTSVMNFVRNLNNAYSNAMIFGHNHAFTSLVNKLGSQYIDNLPTSGLVKIDFDVDSWDALNRGITGLVIFPKHLKS